MDLDKINAEMDINNLYTEEILTDRKMGTMHILTPVDAEGKRDLTRPMVFTGEVQMMTQMGPLPVSFEIEAPRLLKPYRSTANPPRKASSA